jgi:hypothetical protein
VLCTGQKPEGHIFSQIWKALLADHPVISLKTGLEFKYLLSRQLKAGIESIGDCIQTVRPCPPHVRPALLVLTLGRALQRFMQRSPTLVPLFPENLTLIPVVRICGTYRLLCRTS